MTETRKEITWSYMIGTIVDSGGRGLVAIVCLTFFASYMTDPIQIWIASLLLSIWAIKPALNYLLDTLKLVKEITIKNAKQKQN